jgi:hypothetical protein
MEERKDSRIKGLKAAQVVTKKAFHNNVDWDIIPQALY